jgi:two-component system NtrC family response regulator
MVMSRARLLVVDDDVHLRTQMRWALADEYDVTLVEDRPQALAALAAQPVDVVTLDLGLPPRAQKAEEGFAALTAILAADPAAKVVVITARAERDYALKAVALGAYDYFLKPVQIEELKVVLRRAVKMRDLQQEQRTRQRRVDEAGFEGMLGTSPQIQEVFAAIRKVAPSDAAVLITGESGTGKELVARAIHRSSERAEGPFVAINCGAIPENLLESELFGHEKGSFTGAHAQRKGRIECADGGTLFLDEIGELPASLQVKLLRFLQERRIERVGGRQEIAVDVRVISATNVDLAQATQEGRFREDLYYRIGVVVVNVPPLRERRGDIPLLAKAMLGRFGAQNRRPVGGFMPDALRALSTHHWPGNVRELENRVKRAVVMAEGPAITARDLELAAAPAAVGGSALRDARDAVERETIKAMLSRNKGNVSRTAAELGVSRPTLYDLMDKLGIVRRAAAADALGGADN